MGWLIAPLLACALNASAENNPVDEKWWPSEFGAADEVGTANYITPQKRLEAVKLVKRGKTATLGAGSALRATRGSALHPRQAARSAEGASSHSSFAHSARIILIIIFASSQRSDSS
jgi:hypothetical protein